VFKGDYFGVDPYDATNVWNLNTEYPENAEASAPSFHYVLKDIIIIE
jgi:basic membrane protein A